MVRRIIWRGVKIDENKKGEPKIKLVSEEKEKEEKETLVGRRLQGNGIHFRYN